MTLTKEREAEIRHAYRYAENGFTLGAAAMTIEVFEELDAVRAENARLREALESVWREGVTAGGLKDKVKDALWPERKR